MEKCSLKKDCDRLFYVADPMADSKRCKGLFYRIKEAKKYYYYWPGAAGEAVMGVQYCPFCGGEKNYLQQNENAWLME